MESKINTHSFTQYIMHASINSELHPEQKTSLLKKLELKIIAILDAAFTKLSASYRSQKVEIRSRSYNREMMQNEAQKSVKKVFNEATQGLTDVQEKSTPSPQQVNVFDKDLAFEEEELKNRQVNVFDKDLALEEEEKLKNLQAFEALVEQAETDPKALHALSVFHEEIKSLDFDENFKDLFGELDAEKIAETKEEIEKEAEDYQIEKEKEDFIKWFKSGEFKQHLIDNPGALAAFAAILNTHSAKGDLENFLKGSHYLEDEKIE